jgi:hypothetical protein
MNIKPLADRVLVLPAPAENKTVGGIIIPDTAKEKPLTRVVRSLQRATAPKMTRWCSKQVIRFFTENMPAQSWKTSGTRSILSCVRAMCSQ